MEFIMVFNWIESVNYKLLKYIYEVTNASFGTWFVEAVDENVLDGGDNIRIYLRVKCLLCGFIKGVRHDHIVHKGNRDSKEQGTLCPKCWPYIRSKVNNTPSKTEGVGYVYLMKFGGLKTKFSSKQAEIEYLSILKKHPTLTSIKLLKIGQSLEPEGRFSPKETKIFNPEIIAKYCSPNYKTIEQHLLHDVTDRSIRKVIPGSATNYYPLGKSDLQLEEKHAFLDGALEMFDGMTECFPYTDNYQKHHFLAECKKVEIMLDDNYSNLGKIVSNLILEKCASTMYRSVYGVKSILKEFPPKEFTVRYRDKNDKVSNVMITDFFTDDLTKNFKWT